MDADPLVKQLTTIASLVPYLQDALEPTVKLVSYRFETYESPYKCVFEFIGKDSSISDQEVAMKVRTILHSIVPDGHEDLFDNIEIESVPFQTAVME
jgi:hypothetical protein